VKSFDCVGRGVVPPTHLRNKVSPGLTSTEAASSPRCGAGENEWITRDAWGEGCYRSCGFGASVGFDGSVARPGRHDRGCAGARLSKQPAAHAQRAIVRSTDEGVPQALSGYRPKVNLTASAGYQYTDTHLTSGGTPTAIVRTGNHGTNAPRSVGATVTQNVFNGQVTANKTASPKVRSRPHVRGCACWKQTVLLNAATIYMDYLRDSAIVEVQKSNVSRARADA